MPQPERKQKLIARCTAAAITVLVLASAAAAQAGKTNNVVPTWNPNGRIYFSMGSAEKGDVYSTKADGTDLKLFVAGPGADYAPRWTHDGKRGAFMSQRDGDYEIYSIDVDGRMFSCW